MTYLGKPPRIAPSDDPYAEPTERLVQEHLAQHLELLGLGQLLTLVGLEVPVPNVGRVDILARGRDEHDLVVVEVKRDVAGREAVGQLQSYMGGLPHRAPATIRGVLVAAGIDAAAAAALRVATSVTFVDYRDWFVRPDLSDPRFPNGWMQVPVSWLGRRLNVEAVRQTIDSTSFAKLTGGILITDELREFRAKHPFGSNKGIALVRAGRVVACVVTDYGPV